MRRYALDRLRADDGVVAARDRHAQWAVVFAALLAAETVRGSAATSRAQQRPPPVHLLPCAARLSASRAKRTTSSSLKTLPLSAH